MKSLFQKHTLKVFICATALIVLGIMIRNGQKTNRCEAQNPIWNQATELIKQRLHTKLAINSPITLIAALASAFQDNPDNIATFNDIIKCWIAQNGDINKVFRAGDAFPLFFEAEAYRQIPDELKDQPVTILVAFAGLSTLVATLLKNGAQPIVGQTNALDAWAQQELLFLKQSNDEESSSNTEGLRQMLNDALQLLLNASTQDQRNEFFEKYPQLKINVSNH